MTGLAKNVSARTLLLGMLLAITCFYANLARDSYTDDFRAFYVAAVVTHDGLDPYMNQVNVSERYADNIWTRVDSRYIYPPTALLFFAPLAHLSYKSAKIGFGLAMAGNGMGVDAAGAAVSRADAGAAGAICDAADVHECR